MAGEANVWSPSIALVVDGDFKDVAEKLVATEGQTSFTLTTFEVIKGSGALKLYKNGSFLMPGEEFVELTNSSFRLTVPCIAGDAIIAVGNTGVNSETAQAAVDLINAKITVSIAEPLEGEGTDGDIWFKVSI
jgi:hypothetical protein